MGSSALPLLLLLIPILHSGLTKDGGERPKPVVKVSPDHHVFSGETVTLTCDIQTGGNIQWIKYSWIKDGDTHNPYRTTSAAELSFRADSVSVSGQYSCRGERSDSQRSDISDAVTLTLSDLPRPILTVTPDSAVFTGETVNLKCVIESDHSDWTYEWYTDKNSVQYNSHHTLNGDTATIKGAAESDQGHYWCEGVKRWVSIQSSSVSLSVMALPTPTVTVTPDSPVATGETVNLKCVIESNHSDWTYKWYKDKNSVQSKGHHSVNRDTLTIRGAAESDQGQYWCRGLIDGRSVSTKSSAVSLLVKALPTPTVTVTPASAVFTAGTESSQSSSHVSPPVKDLKPTSELRSEPGSNAAAERPMEITGHFSSSSSLSSSSSPPPPGTPPLLVIGVSVGLSVFLLLLILLVLLLRHKKKGLYHVYGGGTKADNRGQSSLETLYVLN